MPDDRSAAIGVNHWRWRRHIIGRAWFDIIGRRYIGPVEHRVGPIVRAIKPGVAEAEPAEEARLCRRGAEPD
jgi:hypothetical protein